MSSQNYESGKLNSLLESSFKKKASGILSLKTQVSHWHNQRSCILMLRDGALVYGDVNVSEVPNSKKVSQVIGENLRPDLINAALSVAVEKSANPSSYRELIELLTKMRVFSWEEVEFFINKKIILILEQFLFVPVKAKWQANKSFDLLYGEDSHSLNWSQIKQEILQRQQKWQQYKPTIPSMTAVPVAGAEELGKISDRNVKKHLKSSADGKSTLWDIAEQMDKDPLKVAKSYVNWVNNGWVTFTVAPQANEAGMIERVTAKIQSNPSQNVASTPRSSTEEPDGDNNLPMVLSVDDSAIIQTSIKRALQEEYQVLLATRASDALKILNENPVELLLLDLTMPDIDGLEFCKIVRRIDRFQDLPIIMVTARDGLVNKMKGHIAGSSRYLTKPFKPDQLRKVVGEYIKS
ncbi:MAG: response regulator [Cyanobacteria bacterium P01_G01_bin.19]